MEIAQHGVLPLTEQIEYARDNSHSKDHARMVIRFIIKSRVAGHYNTERQNYRWFGYTTAYMRKNYVDNKADNKREGFTYAQRKSAADKYASKSPVTMDAAMNNVLGYLQYCSENRYGTFINAEKKIQAVYTRDDVERITLEKFHEYAPPITMEMHDMYHKFRMAFHSLRYLHQLYVSKDNPMQVAYYPSLRALREDKAVRTSMGKYLTKYNDIFGLPESFIKQVAETYQAKISARAGWTLKFVEKDDPDGWVRVYNGDTRSCMRGSDAVRIYAHERSELRLAYIDCNGTAIARCIVRDSDDPDNHGYLRVYPDPQGSTEGRFLKDSLAAAGYGRHIGLEGVLLAYEENHGGIVCPYLDYGAGDTQWVGTTYVNGVKYLEVGLEEYEADRTDGYLNQGCECEECGGRTQEEDMTYIEYDSRNVCETCREENYRYAYGSRYEEYYPADRCVEVDGEWYFEDTISNHDITWVEGRDEYYKNDDLMFFDEGVVHQDDAVALDHTHNGEDYAHPDYVHTLSDGSVCHEDDADFYQSEIDEENEDDESEDDTPKPERAAPVRPVPVSQRLLSVVGCKVGDVIIVVSDSGTGGLYNKGDKGVIEVVDVDNTIYVNFKDQGNRKVIGDGKWWLHKREAVLA